MNVLANLSSRKLALAGFLICAGLICIALYLQYQVGLEPCPLCMLQRLVYYSFGAVCLLHFLHGPGVVGGRIYAGIEFVIAVVGAFTSARHTWLQWNPPDVNNCTADLFYQLRKFPLLSVLERALRATGDCAKVDWTLLGLSIAEWSLVWFVLLALLAIVMFRRAGRKPRALVPSPA